MREGKVEVRGGELWNVMGREKRSNREVRLSSGEREKM